MNATERIQMRRDVQRSRASLHRSPSSKTSPPRSSHCQAAEAGAVRKRVDFFRRAWKLMHCSSLSSSSSSIKEADMDVKATVGCFCASSSASANCDSSAAAVPTALTMTGSVTADATGCSVSLL